MVKPQSPGSGSQSPGSGVQPDDDAILAGITEVARAHLHWTGAVSRDLPLVDTFDLDSLRQLTLLVEIENLFRVRLDDEDESTICTVGDLVDAIRRNLAARAADAR